MQQANHHQQARESDSGLAEYLKDTVDIFLRRRFPALLQTEAAECGIACLAMIAAWHGHQIDLPTLRKKYSVSQRGVTLTSLINIAQKLHLSSRALKVDIEDLIDLSTPCILHWDLHHFVVLTRVTTNRVHLHDPARGFVSMSLSEASKHFTGVALELYPSADFEQKTERQALKLNTLVGRVKGLLLPGIQILLLSLLLEALSLIIPFFTQWVVDGAIVSGDTSLLGTLTIGFALVYLTRIIFALVRSWMIMYVSTHLNLQWTTNVFTHLTRLPITWFERRHLGDINSRFTSVSTIQQTLTSSFTEGIIDGLLAVVTLAVMLLYSAKLSIIVIISLTIYGLLRWASYLTLKKATSESLVLGALQTSIFLETVRAIQAIKLFSNETERRSRWLNALIDSTNRIITTSKINAWFSAANSTISAAETLAVMWLGAGLVLGGGFTVGMLFAFMSYKDNFSARVFSLIDKAVALNMLSVQADRLSDIVLAEPEMMSQEGSLCFELDKKVRLENISFKYGQGDEPVLQNFSLELGTGEFIAIVGPSGCGKSTLAKILTGLIPPTSGSIYCGETLISQSNLLNYRELFGVVMQDDSLLAGSIMDNITFFADHPDEVMARKCANLAAIDREIEAMPMGYHSLVGEMGSALSGGQKQRLLIARALYRQPKILLFDEATSHLDLHSEAVVAENLRMLKISRVVIAHRPQAIKSADRIIELQRQGESIR